MFSERGEEIGDWKLGIGDWIFVNLPYFPTPEPFPAPHSSELITVPK
jgi:hypothetical protein